MIARMVYEPGVLAMVQAGEAIDNCVGATIASDATTVVDKHLDTFYLSTSPPQMNYTISTVRLAGGRTHDYARHILTALKEVAYTYAEYKHPACMRRRLTVTSSGDRLKHLRKGRKKTVPFVTRKC